MEKILSTYSNQRENLMPILHDTQRLFGYLPADAMSQIAEFLGVSDSAVYGVATFYSHFRLKPSGRNTVKMCCGTACHVRGGAHLLRDVESKLGIKPGETTADGEYTLETVACIGACALAPVMLVNEEVYGRITNTDAGKIIDECCCKKDGEAKD